MPTFVLPAINNHILFEESMQDIMNQLHLSSTFNLHKGNGQKQEGVDIYSFEHKTAVQCAQKDLSREANTISKELIKKLLADFKAAVESQLPMERFIFATTFTGDFWILEHCNLLSLQTRKKIEYWHWEKISDYVVCHPELFKKYYPQFYRSGISIGRIVMLDNCGYVPLGKENCYLFSSSTDKSDQPIFDVSLINNSTDTVLLNDISISIRLLNIASAGMKKPRIGWLKPFATILVNPIPPGHISLEWQTVVNPLPDPIYIKSKEPLRLQIQFTEILSTYCKLRIGFKLNDTVISTPEIYFNAVDSGAPDTPDELLAALARSEYGKAK